tara:strand:- start:2343 stop:2543 length:201 start_codon:yes stop_codon:yes gene_type:complete
LLLTGPIGLQNSVEQDIPVRIEKLFILNRSLFLSGYGGKQINLNKSSADDQQNPVCYSLTGQILVV